MHVSPHRRGFYVAENDFAVHHTLRSPQTLYVSFDEHSGPRSGQRLRSPWGYAFAEKCGWSQLGVITHRENWFRDPELFTLMRKLADDGFFAKFDRVVFSGTSMGGYAACAFSSVAPGSTVIAFSPQSTLDPAVAGWDQRYPLGSRADWRGPHSDAAAEIDQAAAVWIVHDPQMALDKRHAQRFQGPNVHLLHARRTRHFTAQFLGQTRILSELVRRCADGRMTEAWFYGEYRRRRQFRRYLAELARDVRLRGKPALQDRLARVLDGLGRKALARDVRG